MPKVNLNDALYERAKQAAAKQGFSSVEELIQHALETALKRLENDEDEQRVEDQLRGLGYIE